MLTTYPLIGRDKVVLKAESWSLLILDEAQTVKNPDAATTRIIRELTARQRFALTGTPLENHLGELWSLFNVVSPGFLGRQGLVLARLPHTHRKTRRQERARHLARRVKPFMLRRTKDQVASELPPKTEIVERIEMERERRDIYEIHPPRHAHEGARRHRRERPEPIPHHRARRTAENAASLLRSPAAQTACQACRPGEVRQARTA